MMTPVSRSPTDGRATSKWIRVFLWTLSIYAIVCMVCGVIIGNLFTHLAHHPLPEAAAHRWHLESTFHAPVQDASITAADGIPLKAWIIQPPVSNGKSVLILHGVSATRIDSTGFAEMFLRQGYAVLMPDSRDHGESGGDFATYGMLERDDVRRWVSWLRARFPGCTYLFGSSMGAAIGLQATAVTPQLCAVAVEDPFARFRQISYERMGRFTHTGPLFWSTFGRPILESTFLYIRLRAGVELPEAEPLKALQQSHTPALLITGTDDVSIPMHHVQELQAACGARCSLWIVPGADHGGASRIAHQEFEQRILTWFAMHDQH